MTTLKQRRCNLFDIILGIIMSVVLIFIILQWSNLELNFGLYLFVGNYILLIGILVSLFIKGFSKNFLAIFFYFCFFIFLMGQKIFMVPWSENFNSTLTFVKNTMNIEQYAIFATLIASSLGVTYIAYDIASRIYDKKHPQNNALVKYENYGFVHPVIRICFILTFICALATQLLIVVKKGNMNYYESYLVNVDVPALLKIGNYLFPPFTFIYLALRPKKKQAFTVLTLYVFVEGIIQLFQGRRALFAANILFAIFYLLIYFRVNKMRFKTFLKIFVGLITVAVVFYLVEAVRSSASGGSGFDLFAMIKDLMISTGGSDSVISNTITRMDQFPNSGVTYLFYPFTVNPINVVINTLFGNYKSYGQGLDYLAHNNDFSHWISYITEPSLYLEGHGMGSSYVAEVYFAFGIFGVIIFSVILGLLFVRFQNLKLDGRYLVRNIFILFFVKEIFTLPRSGTFSWFSNFVYLLIAIVIMIPFTSSHRVYRTIHINKKFLSVLKGNSDGE